MSGAVIIVTGAVTGVKGPLPRRDVAAMTAGAVTAVTSVTMPFVRSRSCLSPRRS